MSSLKTLPNKLESGETFLLTPLNFMASLDIHYKPIVFFYLHLFPNPNNHQLFMKLFYSAIY